MNFFKKVALIIAPLMVIGSPTSGYDYFEHLVKEDIKCGKCGKSGNEIEFTMTEVTPNDDDAGSNDDEVGSNGDEENPPERTDSYHQLYSAPLFTDKVMCEQCKKEHQFVRTFSLIYNRVPIFDIKKLEELTSDNTLAAEWPRTFCCGSKGLPEGNQSGTTCPCCRKDFGLRYSKFFGCMYCGTKVCYPCGLQMANIEDKKGNKPYIMLLNYEGKEMNGLKCPSCRSGMRFFDNKKACEQDIKGFVNKIIEGGKEKYDNWCKLKEKRIVVSFVTSVIENAIKSNKDKIYV